MKVVFIGAGAIGGLFGGLLCNSGHKVIFVEREHKIPSLRNSGLRLKMPDSSVIYVKAEFRADLRGVNDVDVCVVAVKAYDTRSATTHVAFANLSCPVILLQNGLGVEKEAEEVLGRSVARGLTSCGVMTEEVGVIRAVGLSRTVLGSRDEDLLEACFEFADALKSAGLLAEVTRNIDGATWVKTIVNSSINPLGTLFNMKNGELLENEYTRTLLTMIASEGWKVALNLGVELEPQNPVEETFAIARATYNNKNSMLIDVLRGKKTEVDYINGAIWRLAATRSFEAVLNKTLYFMVKAIEQRTIEAGQGRSRRLSLN
ncbi:MAG: ketopantoate reductase family protein [Candidatus Nezhaarchaeales archaeon]